MKSTIILLLDIAIIAVSISFIPSVVKILKHRNEIGYRKLCKQRRKYEKIFKKNNGLDITTYIMKKYLVTNPDEKLKLLGLMCGVVISFVLFFGFILFLVFTNPSIDDKIQLLLVILLLIFMELYKLYLQKTAILYEKVSKNSDFTFNSNDDNTRKLVSENLMLLENKAGEITLATKPILLIIILLSLKIVLSL